MNKQDRVMPGSTIGILGGGQLGRMMALAGRNMGYRFAVMDPVSDCPCGQVADIEIHAAYDDVSAAARLAEQSDVITYEFENVDAGVAEVLEQTSAVPQGSRLLYTTQHRLREKQAIEGAGVQVAPYAEIFSYPQLKEKVLAFGLPCVLKTATGGYDGKGQWVIRSMEEVEQAYDTLQATGAQLVLEKFIRFEKELSVIAARNPAGEIAVYPVAENVHVHNILHLSIVPARVDASVAKRAEEMAKKIVGSLDVVGLIAVELFYTSEGELYVNELAPRPHNSGHYTMEACATSQFEQHIRAVCNLRLGRTTLLTPVVMVNILGEHVTGIEKWVENGEPLPEGMEAKLHLYGKKERAAKRKMGHLNVLCSQIDDALAWIESHEIWSEQTGIAGSSRA
ncbi:5-(carboxyamino)imidazole ribonucleotide synthase [Marinicrinis sediminis]|uniref:N5-carboxyaminoimidazole ribonucleotide synthase n=1 Tax=Marinicrinis sediminis TaxID=1652465 RepID=A0ABW5RAT9_9BACL